jgi:hypothetical protein
LLWLPITLLWRVAVAVAMVHKRHQMVAVVVLVVLEQQQHRHCLFQLLMQ